MNTIPVELKTEQPHVYTGVYQHDYGQILQIHGKNLPAVAEVQFSLQDQGGQTETRVGVTTNDVLEVQVPDKMLKNEGVTENYCIFAYLYITDGKSGNTEYKITIHATSRPAPGEVGEDPDEPHILDEAVNAVNAAAERAEQAEQNAKASAIEAGKYAASASESATAAEKKKQEAIEAIQEQEETSVGKITTHTDDEIQRILNQTAEPKRELEQTITNADASKRELDHSIETAGTSKTALDKSVGLAGTAKTELDKSTQKAGEAKTALDGSAKTAGEMQKTLNATVKQAGTLDTSLGEKIETGTQLKTDLTVSGEKAVQDIQTAGSEQLGKMQAVAEEFTADREQIATNKEDIGSLKEDIVDLSDKKITKFYASNQGETHLADSDKGLVQDIKIYGQSEQSSTTGAQLFNENIEIKNRGVTIKINGSTATFKGTVSDEVNARVNYQKNIKLKPGKYTASSSNKKIKADFSVEKANNETIYNTHIEIDGTEKEVKIRVLFGLKPSAKGDVINETTNIMLNDGDIALPYEPYTGGQPSPSPDYPQEIKRVVKPVVKVCGKNLLQPNLRYKDRVKINIKKGVKLTLICKNGVGSKGGNLKFEKANGEIAWFGFDKGNVKQQITLYYDVVALYYLFSPEPSESYALYIGDENTYEPYTEQSVQLPYTFNAIPVASGGNVTIDGQQYIADYVDVERGKLVKMVDSSKLDNTQSIVNKTEWLLAEPQEIDLTQEEVQTLKTLATYYPATNIFINSEQLDGYTVFNYPISMANGWNYVKQQLGDTRDYIYDMDAKTQDIDTQSAEAYVNSEYAVALTELEV